MNTMTASDLFGVISDRPGIPRDKGLPDQIADSNKSNR
jgi:hypothetical protein